MKILQLHTFYPQYAQSFYRRFPQLMRSAYDEQIAAVLKDGYGAAHMMTPYLQKLGYDTFLVFGNCLYAQSKWLAENDLTIKNPVTWSQDIVRLQIETFKPDIIYATDSVTFDSRFLRSVQWQPLLTLGWRGAPVAAETDWSSFDLILSHLKVFRDKALELGAKASRFFFPGFPKDIAAAVADEPKKYDVVFSGQWSPAHSRRNNYIEALVSEAEKSGNLAIGLFLMAPESALPARVKKYNLGQRFGMDMYRVLKAGRIVVNAEADFAGDEAGNMRLFETAGVGSFLLTEAKENIGYYFSPGSEIETFCDANEMLDKIRFYLAHADDREAIARQGRSRCLNQYSMESRCMELHRIIENHLAKKSPVKTEKYMAQAIEELNEGNIELSLHLLNKAKTFQGDIRGLEYYRACCLLRKNMVEEACNALNNELCRFPSNKDAHRLLTQITSRISTLP